jgi:outer membrane lipoprotein SlyB
VASALATSFFSVLCGAGLAVTAGAVTATAGVAGALAGALAGSAAKAVAANKVAIKVAIDFMIKFPFWLM